MPYSFPTWDEFEALKYRVAVLEMAALPDTLTPTNVRAEWAPDGVNVSLHWDEVPGVTEYRIYRIQDDGSPILVMWMYPPQHHWEITPISPPMAFTITYHVTAVIDSKESEPSSEVTVSWPDPPATPNELAAPQNLQFAASAGPGEGGTLSWNVVSNAEGYKLYFSLPVWGDVVHSTAYSSFSVHRNEPPATDEVYVKAISWTGESPPSEAIVFTR